MGYAQLINMQRTRDCRVFSVKWDIHMSSLPQGSGNFTEEEAERLKEQRWKMNSRIQHFPAITRHLYIQTPSDCDSIHKTYASSILTNITKWSEGYEHKVSSLAERLMASNGYREKVSFL